MDGTTIAVVSDKIIGCTGVNRWTAILLPVPNPEPLLAAAVVTERSGEPVDFIYTDSDHSGYVSRVEARSVSAVENQFDLADTNQDGLLDKEEYVGLGNARASR